MKLVDTTYGLSGDVLDARNGAIAVNAYFETLRALGRANRPLIDLDYRKIKMLKKLLNSVGEVQQESLPGELTSPVQAVVPKRFDTLEKSLAAALDLVDDQVEEIASATATKRRGAA